MTNNPPKAAVLSVDEILTPIVYPMVGPRCKTKDIEDFPELSDEHTGGRCLVCTTYEEIDNAKAQLATYLTNAFERVITKSERVYLYGSEKQLAMDEGEQFENDLAMARNALRAEQRVIAKQIIEELNK